MEALHDKGLPVDALTRIILLDPRGVADDL